MIVLDTSVLLYWTLEPSRLTPSARQAIEGADRILISSISIWEIALKVKQQKLYLPLQVEDYVERPKQAERVEVLPVDVQIWLDNIDLLWEHRDPADRTIVALALHYRAPLISSDQTIQEFYSEAVW